MVSALWLSSRVQLRISIGTLPEVKTKFIDFEDFQSVTGLIDDFEELKLISIRKFAEPNENRIFEIDAIDGLKKFCSQNSSFHIATLTSDSDESESEVNELCAKEMGRNWDEMPEVEKTNLREYEQIRVTTIDNWIRIVNRLNYYLCRGNKDPELFLKETRKLGICPIFGSN